MGHFQVDSREHPGSRWGFWDLRSFFCLCYFLPSWKLFICLYCHLPLQSPLLLSSVLESALAHQFKSWLSFFPLMNMSRLLEMECLTDNIMEDLLYLHHSLPQNMVKFGSLLQNQLPSPVETGLFLLASHVIRFKS